MTAEAKTAATDLVAEKAGEHAAAEVVQAAANAAPDAIGGAADRDPGEAKDDGEASYVFVDGDSDVVAADPSVAPELALVSGEGAGGGVVGGGKVDGGVGVGGGEAASLDQECEIHDTVHPASGDGEVVDLCVSGSKEEEKGSNSIEIEPAESEEVQIKEELVDEKLESKSENSSPELENGKNGNLKSGLEIGENGDLKSGLELENGSVEEEKLEEGVVECEVAVDSVNEIGDAPSVDVDGANLEKVVLVKDEVEVTRTESESKPPNGTLESNGVVKDEIVDGVTSETEPEENAVLGDEIEENLVEDARSKCPHPAYTKSTSEVENGVAEMNHHSEAVTEIRKAGESVDSDSIKWEDDASDKNGLPETKLTHDDNSKPALNGIDERNGSLEEVESLPTDNLDVVELQPEGIKWSQEIDPAGAPGQSSLNGTRSFSIGAFEFPCGQDSVSPLEESDAAASVVEVREDEIVEKGSTNCVDEVKVEPETITIPVVEDGRIVDEGSTNCVDEVKVEPEASTIPVVEDGRIVDEGSTNCVDEVKVEPDASTIPVVEDGRIVDEGSTNCVDEVKVEPDASTIPVVEDGRIVDEGSANCVNEEVKVQPVASTIPVVENERPSTDKDHDGKIASNEMGDKNSEAPVVHEQKPEVQVLKKSFDYIVKMPRFVDDELRERIRLAQIEVEQKTQSRDIVRVKIQKQKAICGECKDKFDASRVEENAAREAFAAKRKEFELAQASSSIEELNEKICGMEHKIQHETLALKDEKQMIREIKQIKQTRDQLYASLSSQSDREVIEKKDDIEARLQKLKTELNTLRVELVKVEDATKALRRKHVDENDSLKKLQTEYRDVDSSRQEAYAELQRLKKDMYEKNKQFYQYKDDYREAINLAAAKDFDRFSQFCANQREKLHQLYAKDDQFRREYLQRNMGNTIRRLKTLEARSLGPDEEPQALSLPRTVVARFDASGSATSNVIVNAEAESRLANASEILPAKNDSKAGGVLGSKDLSAKPKKTNKPTSLGLDSEAVSSRVYEAEEELKEKKLSKEEEEIKRKEEERARKEEDRKREAAAAREKEQRRLEEIAKAKDAEERKRRQAEKAQARAEFKAKKEAELKEREKQKKAKKKEKKRGTQVDDAGEIDAETLQNGPPEPAPEPEFKEKPVVVAKRYSKSAAVKKVVPPPLPLRNRSKRKIQAWMWWTFLGIVLVTVILVATNILFGFGRSVFQF